MRRNTVRTFKLLVTPGHTTGEVAVDIPEVLGVIASDTVFSGCQTLLCVSSIPQWIESLKRLMGLDANIIIRGHGVV